MIDNDKLAMILVAVGTSCYSLGFIYNNQHGFNPILTNLTRGLMNIIICYAIMKHQNMDMCFKSTLSLKWNIFRNSIMVFEGLAYAAIQFYLPLPISITLNAISPMIIYIYDYFLYGITINKKQLIFLMISFIGALLTANGTYILSVINQNQKSKESSFENYRTDDPIIMMKVAFIFMLIKVIHGYGVVITKQIKYSNGFQISYIQGILVFVFSGLALPYITNQINYKQIDYSIFLKSLLFSGTPIALGSTLWITALTLSKNFGMITTVSFISMVLGYLVSIFRYGQQVNVICTLGSVLLVIGITFLIKFKDAPKPQ